MEWNFEENFTQNVPSCKTQQIDAISSTSSESEEEREERVKVIGPSQRVTEDSETDEMMSTSSPIFHSKKRRRKRSPIYASQSLLDSSGKRLKKTLLFNMNSSASEDLFADSQKIESVPSSLSQVPAKLNDSNVIESTSSNSTVIETNDLQIHEKLIEEHAKKKSRKRRKKHGLAEQLDNALKKLASDRILSCHLPDKLKGSSSLKNVVKKARVVNKTWLFSMLVLTCVDFQLEHGQKQQFQVIVDNINEFVKNGVKNNSEILLEGPWFEFCDDQGQKVLTHVSKIEIIHD